MATFLMFRKINLIVILFLFVTPSVFAQDFTSTISKMAFENRVMLGHLKRCHVSQESIVIFEKIIHKLKEDKLPNDAYKQLYEDSYEAGKQSVLSNPDADKIGCEKYLKSEKELIEYGKKHS